MVMPTNGSYPWLHRQAGRSEVLGLSLVGHLYSPGGERGPYPRLPYALDNGAFAGFDAGRWRALLNWACLCGTAPLWVAVPDVIEDPGATSARWIKHHKEAARFGWPLAFVVQDGHLANDVPPLADVVFVGGSTEWKRETIGYWCGRFPRVHVGRINTYKWLRYCADAGAESCDGTGWARGDKRQLAGLMQFFREEEAKHVDRTLGETRV